MAVAEEFESGWLHRPENPDGNALVLTHGAGSNANAPLLKALGEAFSEAGILVYRYNLPFRIAGKSSPPMPAAQGKDRAGVQIAVDTIRALTPGKIVAGGHSYGGRQTTMLAAENAGLADALLLLSYPLHAPGKIHAWRTGHFPSLTMPSLFIHGSRDPFGTEEEMREGLKKIPAHPTLYVVEGAGHDLGKNHSRLAFVIVQQAKRLFTDR